MQLKAYNDGAPNKGKAKCKFWSGKGEHSFWRTPLFGFHVGLASRFVSGGPDFATLPFLLNPRRPKAQVKLLMYLDPWGKRSFAESYNISSCPWHNIISCPTITLVQRSNVKPPQLNFPNAQSKTTSRNRGLCLEFILNPTHVAQVPRGLRAVPKNQSGSEWTAN